MGQIPSAVPGATNPKENSLSGDITPSNKSPQTPQAASQNVPQGRAPTSGTKLISTKGRTLTNGKMGKSSFR